MKLEGENMSLWTFRGRNSVRRSRKRFYKAIHDHYIVPVEISRVLADPPVLRRDQSLPFIVLLESKNDVEEPRQEISLGAFRE